MSRSPEHICWGKEPWFAWDLWNEVEEAPLLIDAMLNGGYARAPALVGIDHDGRSEALVLPDVVDLSPVIGDYKPVTTECGLWLAVITADDTVVGYENEKGFEFSADVKPHLDEREYVNGYLAILWRPWHVELLADASEDNCEDFNETLHWLNANIVHFDEGDKYDHADLARIRTEFVDTQDVQRLRWFRFLSAMAPRHECAALMLEELSKEMNR